MSAATGSAMAGCIAEARIYRFGGGDWLGHLLWKDLRLLRSLMWAALIAPLAVVALVSLSRLIGGWPWQPSVELRWLVILPGLVALGTPPMVVGTEDEEHTLDWLRRLPISWWRVLVSKVIASLLMLLLSLLWTAMVGAVCAAAMDAAAFPHMLLTWPSIVFASLIMYISLVVLTLGFFTSFLIRNPMAAAISVIPLSIAWLQISLYFYSGQGTLSPQIGHAPILDVLRWSRFYAASLSIQAVVTIATLELARYRLVGPSDQRSWFVVPLSNLFFRVRETRPVALQLGSRLRPSLATALLWQHVAQSRHFYLGVTIAAAILPIVAGLLSTASRAVTELIVYPVNAWLQIALGVSVFHGDHRKMRRYFFSDRGVPAGWIWATRMIVPLSLSLAISLTTALMIRTGGMVLRTENDMSLVLPPIYTLLFLIGVSTGQWVRRGVSAFFIAPVIAYLAASSMALATGPVQAFMTWREVAWMGAFALASLLASSVHLNKLSLRGMDGPAVTIRAVAWLALPAVLMAIVSGIWRLAIVIKVSDWQIF